MEEQPGEITILLRQWRQGTQGVEDKLFDLVFPHLRRIARKWLNKERRGHPMDSVGLAAEAYLGLLPAKDRVDWQNRDHFFAYSARVMKNYLIDVGRKRATRPEAPLPSDDIAAYWPNLDATIAVAQCMEELEKVDPQLCRVVEFKVLLRLTDEETAEAMNLGLHTTQRRWHKARKWLFVYMKKKC
jgi:RNA polymerase sigma factor (TIGR02999 family)